MPKNTDSARPAIDPTTRPTAGTMYVALYGELVLHAWRNPESERDAYALFHQRALAMGWLDTSTGVRRNGSETHTLVVPALWAMNDAGWEQSLGTPGAQLISWFQVEANAVAGDQPLPVQPFLRCAEDTTARAGTLDLSAVQVLLPVQGLETSSRPFKARPPSMLTVDWFAECDPKARTPVEVSVNSGRDPSIPAVVEQLTDHLGRLEQDVFVSRSHEIVGQDAVLRPPFGDGLWNGPPLHGVVLRGELAEWSCDAVGWLAEVIADCAAQLGVRSPLLLTVTRTQATS